MAYCRNARREFRGKDMWFRMTGKIFRVEHSDSQRASTSMEKESLEGWIGRNVTRPFGSLRYVGKCATWAIHLPADLYYSHPSHGINTAVYVDHSYIMYVELNCNAKVPIRRVAC